MSSFFFFFSSHHENPDGTPDFRSVLFGNINQKQHSIVLCPEVQCVRPVLLFGAQISPASGGSDLNPSVQILPV
ncbi:hypothetical protein AMECASPLE_009280 [Ameca splendens]|uniref:Uncharacterized protein n=1 Tax=Ameca splendens TaxID=208324 RepID=A0ABV0XP54_9TELE